MQTQVAKFTWFSKMTEALMSCPDDETRGKLARAIAEYGTYGTEPDLGWPLAGIFAVLREDIDNSVNARVNNRGGRPSKRDAKECDGAGDETPDHAVDDDPEKAETGVSDNGNGGFEVSEKAETGVSGSGEEAEPLLIYQSIPYQSKPNQTNPDQTKGHKARGGAARFRAHTVGEVADYAAQAGLSLDAGRFCDFYGSKGWTVGKSPMRDWRAAARNWAREEAARAAKAGPGREAVESAGDVYSLL